MSILSLHRPHTKRHEDEFVDELRNYADLAPATVETLQAPRRLHHAPGSTRAVLAELRADTAPVPPTALRHAFDPCWLPVSVGLRTVDLAAYPIEDIADDLTAVTAYVDRAPFARHEPDVAAALTQLAAMLAEVAV